MDIKYKNTGGNMTVYLNGDLDEYSAGQSKNQLDRLIDDNLNIKRFVFNLSGLSFMDSTGIGMLIGRYKKLKRFGIPVFLSGASVNVEKIIEISGLYGIMPKY